ncbi:MAG: hypothetical protein O2968_09440, partial [Acidobacteria bacterium]|nr:hypothetical protein [Acidobacteriota bacterium]
CYSPAKAGKDCSSNQPDRAWPGQFEVALAVTIPSADLIAKPNYRRTNDKKRVAAKPVREHYEPPRQGLPVSRVHAAWLQPGQPLYGWFRRSPRGHLGRLSGLTPTGLSRPRLGRQTPEGAKSA